MAKHVGSATASGSVAGSGSGAASAAAGGTGVAQQGGEEAAPFISQIPGTPVVFPTFHGRRVSWVAVSLIMIAFAIGGAALASGPIWWLFWAGFGLAAVGVLMSMAIGIFDDWY
ncbi:MAG: hypothetical protein ACRDOK_18490 [Streptosporangiaceae bacterium]